MGADNDGHPFLQDVSESGFLFQLLIFVSAGKDREKGEI
jgi:hypothetical protein